MIYGFHKSFIFLDLDNKSLPERVYFIIRKQVEMMLSFQGDRITKFDLNIYTELTDETVQ